MIYFYTGTMVDNDGTVFECLLSILTAREHYRYKHPLEKRDDQIQTRYPPVIRTDLSILSIPETTSCVSMLPLVKIWSARQKANLMHHLSPEQDHLVIFNKEMSSQ
jgi:hypothetical protein